MYMGKVEVEEHHLESFLRDAAKLKIKGLDMQANSKVVTPALATTSLSSKDKEEHNLVKEEYQNISEIENQVQTLDDISTPDAWDDIDDDDNVYSEISGIKTERKESHHQQQLHYCGKCDYKSNRRYNVKKHMLSVHEGIRYPCNQCDSKFSETGELRKHERKQHRFE